jgi:hypothetical protein
VPKSFQLGLSESKDLEKVQVILRSLGESILSEKTVPSLFLIRRLSR